MFDNGYELAERNGRYVDWAPTRDLARHRASLHARNIGAPIEIYPLVPCADDTLRRTYLPIETVKPNR